jgi:hypothetical protein
MATIDITTLPTFILLQDVPSVYISTEEASLNVSISVDGTEVYAETLYAYGGKVTIHSLKELIESDMFVSQKTLSTVSITAEDSVLAEFRVLYSSAVITGLDVDSFAQYCFLSFLRSKRVPTSYSDALFMVADASEAYTLKLLYNDADGSLQSSTIDGNTSASIGLFCISIDVAACQKKLDKGATLLAIVVTCGARRYRYYIDKSLDVNSRLFTCINNFNVPETLCLQGESELKYKVTRSQAMCGGVTSFYDTSIADTAEFNTASIPASETEALKQLLSSSKVMMFVAGSEPQEILITESSYSVQDPTTALGSVKFTYQYPTGRQLSAASQGRIFTQEFTAQFK